MNPEQNPIPGGAPDSTPPPATVPPPAAPQAPAMPSTQPQQVAAPPSPPSPVAAPAAQATVKSGPSKAKRVGLCILGVLLILFSFSIVSGQSSHGWDAVGIIMILFFGLIGIFLIYSAIFAKGKKQ